MAFTARLLPGRVSISEKGLYLNYFIGKIAPEFLSPCAEFLSASDLLYFVSFFRFTARSTTGGYVFTLVSGPFLGVLLVSGPCPVGGVPSVLSGEQGVPQDKKRTPPHTRTG